MNVGNGLDNVTDNLQTCAQQIFLFSFRVVKNRKDNNYLLIFHQIVAGAGEFLPMYEKQVQEKCIEFVLDPKGSEEQVKSMAEILRLRLANQSVTKLMGALRDMSNEDLTDAEFNCYKSLGQLYELPEDTLKAFIKRCLSLGRTDRTRFII